MKKRRQIKHLVAPMREVSAGGAVPNAVAVHKQNKAVVGADADGVAGGDCGQFERAAEMQDYRFAQGRRRVSNPGGFPLPVGGSGWTGFWAWIEADARTKAITKAVERIDFGLTDFS